MRCFLFIIYVFVFMSSFYGQRIKYNVWGTLPNQYEQYRVVLSHYSGLGIYKRDTMLTSDGCFFFKGEVPKVELADLHCELNGDILYSTELFLDGSDLRVEIDSICNVYGSEWNNSLFLLFKNPFVELENIYKKINSSQSFLNIKEKEDMQAMILGYARYQKLLVLRNWSSFDYGVALLNKYWQELDYDDWSYILSNPFNVLYRDSVLCHTVREYCNKVESIQYLNLNKYALSEKKLEVFMYKRKMERMASCRI